jgi:hypothetical protein
LQLGEDHNIGVSSVAMSSSTGSILPSCYENNALNTDVFFIYEIVKQFTESQGFKEKMT